ncbi:MAG: hypothetical protein WA776_16565 [Xanthobacteraceae bacterium]
MSADEHIHYAPEPADVDTRIVLWAAIAALVLLFGAIGGLYAVYDYDVPIKTVPSPKEFPQPRVVTQEADIAELHRLAAAQNQRLKTWSWANAQHTLVQIPIDRAMKLLVQKGGDAYAPLLPPQGALSSPTAGAQNAITPSSPTTSSKPTPEQRP